MKKPIVILLLALLCGCDDLFEKDISGRSPEILAPADSAVVAPAELMLLWRPMEGADAYRITVVSPDFAHAGQVLADTVVSGCRYIQRGLRPGTCQWSVSAFNFGYDSPAAVRTLIVRDDESTHPIVVPR